MDKNIITETVNGVTNYISLNEQGQLVSAAKNPMELPAFMTKEQAFKVIAGLRQAAAGTETKYRVKAVSQALRDMITDIIYNQLPETPMVEDAVIAKALESWKPAVKQQEEPKAEAKATEEQPAEAETAEEPAEEAAPEVTESDIEEPAKAESKPAKKAKKQNK